MQTITPSAIRGLVLAALPFFVAAAPLDSVRTSTGIRIPLSKRYVAGEYTSARMTYTGRDYNDSSTTDLIPSSKREITGLVSLQSHQNVFWHGPITVGSKELQVDFDTGSADLILRGPTCAGPQRKLPYYNPRDSKTHKALHEVFEVDYADLAGARGDVYSDTVTIAGLTVTEQGIGVTGTMCRIESQIAGTVGMGFIARSSTGQASLMHNLVTQKQIPRNLFSLKLGTDGCASELALGFADENWYVKPSVDLLLIGEDEWQVQMDEVTVDGEKVAGPGKAIIDTGSNIIFSSEKNVLAFHEKLKKYTRVPDRKGQTRYTFPCKDVPSVSFVFGGTTFQLSPDSFNQGSRFPGSSDCYSAVGVLPDLDSDTWIVGDVFLTNVYTSFSGELPRPYIRFATLSEASRQCGTPSRA